ncbi:MAG: hypothetical protein IJ190_11795 [Prevotella sp.]|nr:hypothetical protein [Prevotella sp.]
MKKLLFAAVVMLFATNMSAQQLNDLISFSDILKTNGDFGTLVKTHGFKQAELFSGRGAGYFVYYKNCVKKKDNDHPYYKGLTVIPAGIISIVPFGKGTSIRITENPPTRYGATVEIEVFNAKAFAQLKEDFLRHAKLVGKYYQFKWANGEIVKEVSLSEYENGKGGYIQWTIPFDEIFN